MEATAIKTLKARALLAEASARCGDESIERIVVPTIERIMQGQAADMKIVDLVGYQDKGLVKVLRAPTLGARLRKIGLSDDQIGVAVRFARDFHAAMPGSLTANYDGFAGGSKRCGEAERFLIAMDVLIAASRGPLTQPLTHDERIVLYGYVLYDVSAADLGAFVASGITPDEKYHKFTGKLLLNKALNKLMLHYEDADHVRERHQNERNRP